MRQTRGECIAGNFHGLIFGKLFLQLFHDTLTNAAEHFARHFQAQELLAGNDWLPEQEICRFVDLLRSLCSQQAAGPQAPEPQGRLTTVAQPGMGILHILQPALPGGIAEISRTVAAAVQIDLQNGVAVRCEHPRLQGRHAS
ncbi:MAG: hypothetical protein Q8L93_05350 [Rhodocyclaceae bacterium]|nr:hypothetical protein [Rhodocyclaceae bacterium]